MPENVKLTKQRETLENEFKQKEINLNQTFEQKVQESIKTKNNELDQLF